MSFQALRRAAASSSPALRKARCLLFGELQQQGSLVVSPVLRSEVVASAAGRSRAPLWASASRFSAVARDPREADAALVSVLRSELDVERKTYNQSKELTRGPPKPWTLTDKQGQADIILRRAYGLEDIAVTCVYQPDSYDPENESGDMNENSEDERDPDDPTETSSINMSISITKGADKPTLEISASCYGDAITIDHVHFWEDKDTKESVYDGPNFMQLDEQVQSHFEKYIKARGINRDLTGYLFTLLADKEQREYMRWLQKVEGFLKQ